MRWDPGPVVHCWTSEGKEKTIEVKFQTMKATKVWKSGVRTIIVIVLLSDVVRLKVKQMVMKSSQFQKIGAQLRNTELRS